MEHKDPLIAVVNDEPSIIEMLCQLLVEEGYQVLTAESGAEAHPIIQQALPDLIILDMQMEQRESGLVLLELLRLEPTTEPIPIIMCSADGAFLRENAAHLQAHGCTLLEKPYTLEELLVQIQASIRPSQPRENAVGRARHQGP
jgi:CheY-like chemotaxis protein